MTGLIMILAAACIGALLYIVRMRKQLTEWRAYLQAVREAPERKQFVKGEGLLAEINFELNDILAQNRRELVRLQRAETANRQLLTDLSHDVRTPLASLTGYLEALSVQGASPREEYIQTAYRKALDLQSMIDILFQWCKLTSQEQLYEPGPYDINEMTREILIGHLPQWESRGISLVTHISDEEWTVFVDKAAYARIVDNILNNAVEHGKCTVIELEIQRNEEHILISIANDGAAIAPEKLPFLFERLYKCDASRTGSGSGLGLAIARELTQAMGGEISVWSAAGQQTVFRLIFPDAAKGAPQIQN